MRSLRLLSAIVFLFSTLVLAQSTSLMNPPLAANRSASALSTPNAQTQPHTAASVNENYGKLPLSFEANQGQTDPQVKFLTRTSGYSLFLTGDEAVLAPAAKKLSGKQLGFVSRHRFSDAASSAKPEAPLGAARLGQSPTENASIGVLHMKLRNANPAAKIIGVDKLAGVSNYFIGNDPAKWRTNVPTYAKVKYQGIYSGIDLLYYGNQRQLEYDFIVAPGADPHRIAFDVRGAQAITQDAHGDLVFKIGDDEIRWHKPAVYQERDGARQEIAANYYITDANRVGFRLAKYDPSRALYIDPLIYSTYLGGSGSDQGQGIAVDSLGSAYVTGFTNSTDFPTLNASQPVYGGSGDAFVSKLNPTGSALVYSTYLGGSGGDSGYGIAVDNTGNVYVTGNTSSLDFPVTPGAFQTTFDNGGIATTDAFVTKLIPNGSALIYSTYLGSSADGNGIAVDSKGNAYVTGATNSTNFPTTPGALQTTYGGEIDAFISKVNSTGSALVYSTYLGGSGEDGGNGIALDRAGNAYVIGVTASTNFPTMNPVQPAFGGGQYDAFVSKLNSTGSALVYSTYLGGSEIDWGAGIAVDRRDNVYVAGQTTSTNFPTVRPLQPANGGGLDAFVSQFNADGSGLVYSTYFGGSGSDSAYAIAVDSLDHAFVAGNTDSTDFPVTHSLQPFSGDDAFVAQFDQKGSALGYSTYLGGIGRNGAYGIAVDDMGSAYVTGFTDSTNFPTTPGVFQTACGGGDANCQNGDGFVSKIAQLFSSATMIASSPNPSDYEEQVTFTAVVTSGEGAPPDGETISFMKGKTVLGTGKLSGGTATFTTSTLKIGKTSVTAVYGGDSNFGGSTSKPVNQVVNKAGE